MLFIGIWLCPTSLTISTLDCGSWFTYFMASVKFWVFKFGNECVVRNSDPCAKQKSVMHSHTAPEPGAGICSHATSTQREWKPIVYHTKLQRTGPWSAKIIVQVLESVQRHKYDNLLLVLPCRGDGFYAASGGSSDFAGLSFHLHFPVQDRSCAPW